MFLWHAQMSMTSAFVGEKGGEETTARPQCIHTVLFFLWFEKKKARSKAR